MARTENLGLYKWLTSDTKVTTINEIAANAEILDAEIKALQDERVKTADLPYTKVGNAASFISSIYVDNDNNYFAYDSAGVLRNLATIQQNDIMDYGTTALDHMWLRAKTKVSVRAPQLTIATELNPDGTAKTEREVYHVGNKANHAMLQCSSGTQTLTINVENKLTLLNTVASSFPVGALSSNNYTIPRTGIYSLEFTAKVSTALTATNSYLRFGISRNRGGVTTDIDIKDVLGSSAYGTPFLGTETMLLLNKDDVITPWIKPLTENVTIGAGSKFNVYFKGDSPSA
jgi:hypothetical protein